MSDALTRPVTQAARERLLAALGPDDRAWLRSCGGPGAGTWLLNPTTGPQMEDRHFVCASRMRLGQPLAPPGRARQRGCGRALDEGGHYAHWGNRERWRNAWHNAVQHATARILRSLSSFGVVVREHPDRVPEWDTPRERAVLDLCVEGGPGALTWWRELAKQVALRMLSAHLLQVAPGSACPVASLKPVPRSLAARLSQLTPRDPCRPQAW